MNNYKSEADTHKSIMKELLGDTFDKCLQGYDLFEDCLRRAKACEGCKWANSQKSLKEIEDAEKLWKTMTIIQNPLLPHDSEMRVILCDYPLDRPVSELYPTRLSNSSQYRAATISLYKRLKVKGLLPSFNDQMVKSIKEGHCVMLSKEEEADY